MAVPTLKEQMAADLENSYNPDMPWVEMATAAGVDGEFPVRMVLNRMRQPQEKEYQHQTLFIRVRKSDWPNPAYGHVITFAGQTWYVENIAEARAAEWSLVINREVRPVF